MSKNTIYFAKVQLFTSNSKINEIKIDVRAKYLQNENEIKNTRHSSGYGLTLRLSVAYNMMSAMMTRQALVMLLLINNQLITGNPDE